MIAHRFLFVLAVAAAFTVAAPATRAEIPDEAGSFPVQYQGRVVPFSSFSREILLEVTGKLSVKGQPPAETVLMWLAFAESTNNLNMFSVGYEPLRDAIGLEARRRFFSFNELAGSEKLRELAMQSSQIREREGKPTRVQSDAERLWHRLTALWALHTRQTPGFIPAPFAKDAPWAPLSEGGIAGDDDGEAIRAAYSGLIQGVGRGDIEGMRAAALNLDQRIRARWGLNDKQTAAFNLEVTYNRLNPIYLGRMLYLAGLLTLLASLVGWAKRLVPISGWVIFTGWIVHVAALLMRTQIGGRAPWSNLYESLIALAAVLVGLGLLFRKPSLRGAIWGGVAFAGFAALLIADNAGLSPAVDTLVPALQSYWLTIHVIVILSGYAAAALAMLIAHVALGIEAFRPGDRPLFVGATNAIYRSVQIAMLLLFAGTILGGVWAHEAWGRYWGWDPKETWALISWFGYLGVAHARFAGWLKPRGLALAAIGVFPLILMTYYGVNYLLSGLHSYAGGQSAAIPPLLIWFLVFEALVIVVCGRGWHVAWAAKAALGGGNTKPKLKESSVTEVES